MSRLTDKKIVKTTPVEVSPISSLPAGLDEGQYSDGDGLNTTAQGEQFNFSAPTTEVTGPTDPGERVRTPRILGIKSQTVRHENGVPVVDVILDVEDIDEAIHYEVRYAYAPVPF